LLNEGLKTGDGEQINVMLRTWGSRRVYVSPKTPPVCRAKR